MFKFLNSIFSNDATSDNYPETIVHAAIEHAVDSTDPWIRAVFSYERKLRPAVIRAIDYVVTLVDTMATPIVVEPGSYESNALLRTFFFSKDDMLRVLANDRNLMSFLKGQADAPPLVFALLVMAKQEKVIIGAELSGDIVLHDIPQTVVSFEAHRLLDPSVSEVEARHHAKRRLFNHLLGLALRRIVTVKTERGKLERYRSILQSKLDLLQRAGWGFNETTGDEHLDVTGIEVLISRLEAQLQELGGDDRMLEVYLDIVADVLSQPEQHLWARKESLVINRMGVKRSKDDGNTPEVTLDMFANDEGRSMVVTLTALAGDVIWPERAEPFRCR
ncbi:MAG: hypothetical protein A2076_12910 [Geobacteraceae bacterium GWC2_53_11]|nr:MAG: hypothetical protein A2076_12910 [Geobacteraceae bacterium GWC2_53_11]